MKQYSAADIQRYLKGEMSAEEMHAIETAALDDPFLADAIEGFEMAMTRSEEEAIGGLQKLQSEFAERTRPVLSGVEGPKVVPIRTARWWWMSAAAVILLITGVALYNNWMWQQTATSPLAVTQKHQVDTTPMPRAEEERASVAQTSPDSNRTRNDETGAPVSPSKPTIPELTKPTEEGLTANPLLHDKDVPAAAPPAEQKDLAKQDVERLQKSKKAEADEYVPEPRSAQKEGAAADSHLESLARRNQQIAAQLKNFSGRVVDQNNKPLANASVQVVQSKSSVLTDEYGGFNFSSKDSIVDVQVGLIGFEQRNFRLQNNLASNNLVLEPSKAQLDEVVVTGYGGRKKREVSKMTTRLQHAVPVGGWIEYEKYLDKNKRPPTNNPLMKGEVVISFDVNRSGQLTDFKTEKSLSTDYDNEAIRLIKEGPAWKLTYGRKTRITVIVKF